MSETPVKTETPDVPYSPEPVTGRTGPRQAY